MFIFFSLLERPFFNFFYRPVGVLKVVNRAPRGKVSSRDSGVSGFDYSDAAAAAAATEAGTAFNK